MSRPTLFGLGLIAALLGGLGCDALVGGACADGYEAREGHCAPPDELIAVDDTPDGGGGGDDADGGHGGGDAGAGGGEAPGGGQPEGGAGGGALCEPGLTVCGSACVDTDSNIYHCGDCNQYCPTESCVDGTCQGGTLGHVAVIGMSYQAWSPPSRRLLGNAVFMAQATNVRVLDYRQYGNPASVKSVVDLVEDEAALRNRTWELSVAATPSAIASDLTTSSYDVLLIHDQAFAPAGFGLSFATQAQAAIGAFGEDGGIVVVLATSSDEMPSLLTATGLLDTAGFVPITGSTVVKNAPTDVLALGVASPFTAKAKTVAIVTGEQPSPLLSVVFSDDSAAANPVAIHRVVSSATP